jgi:hypothetical protein
MAKRIALISALVLGVVVVVLLIGSRRAETVAGFTARTPAEITDVQFRSSQSVTFVSYRFTVGGRSLEGRSRKSGDGRDRYAEGATATACYDPADPEASEVFPASYDCSAS